MPVFHTKIIESILEPVAQQVSRLVILHEEAEDGNAMPDLARPVQAVSLAVNNLVKVGHETIESSEDQFLRQDMPAALRRVEAASALLQHASDMLRADPYSAPARKKLIEGSRGILQGTSALLLCFDESEVRKIVRECKKVLDYLGVAEVIDTMEDLVQFLRDISPALSKAAREVASRASELTHPPHAETLTRCLENVKQLAPVLIGAMKIYIHILTEGSKGIEDASQNRNYLAQKMADEIHEIIRVLQLTSYVEDGGEKNNVAVLKALQSQIQAKLPAAYEFLDDPSALRNSGGERALRSVLASGQSAAGHVPAAAGDALRKNIRSAGAKADDICELRQQGRGRDPACERHAADARALLRDIDAAAGDALRAADAHGGDSMQARLDTAHRWLMNPGADPATRVEAQKAINSIVKQGHKIADELQGREKAEILELCSNAQRLSDKLADLCMSGKGDTPEAREIQRQLIDALSALRRGMEGAVVRRVVEDFIDVAAPLRLFHEAATAPDGTPGREERFGRCANNLSSFSSRCAGAARLAAAAATDKRLADTLMRAAGAVEQLDPQLRAAGNIRMLYPGSKVADEHYNNLKNQYSEAVLRARDLCDQAVDPLEFVKTAGELMNKHTYLCEDAIRNHDSQKMVDNTSAIARLANRVLLVGGAERDNTEDAALSALLGAALARLQAAIPPAVRSAKCVALGDSAHAPAWATNNNEIRLATTEMEDALASRYRRSPPPPPPLPPLDVIKPTYREPAHAGNVPPQRPPPPAADPDAEAEHVFSGAGGAGAGSHPAHPILVAAHSLHAAVRDWSARDNDIVAAAKRMAVLMARLAHLVRSDSTGSKRELIATAKAIAEASEEVTRLAKKLAMECTDKRIRTNLLQVCERIPTIGTQLKILSTVKATMLGAQGSEEDQEATEMLVGNAQNLMQSVKETVKASEGASIKIRTEQGGYRLRWVRREPWYHM